MTRRARQGRSSGQVRRTIAGRHAGGWGQSGVQVGRTDAVRSVGAVYSGGCRPHKGLRAGLIAVAQYIGAEGMNGDQGATRQIKALTTSN